VLATWSTSGVDALADVLDPDVVWQGLSAELVCTGRDQVLALLGRRRWPLRVSRIEAAEAGDRVAISVEGPDFPSTDLLGAADPRSLVLTFRDGRVVRMESFRTAGEAFAHLSS
jgi:ketosteroid isomerase-like protein